MNKKKQTREHLLIGWREWGALPELGIPAIKFKTDTGATTSALHATHIETFFKDGLEFVRFKTHPIQRDSKITARCEARLFDQSHIKSSTGHQEHRYVIKTPLVIAGLRWEIKLTLTSRETMGFRMLLGREAMRGRLLVDPDHSYVLGRVAKNAAKAFYSG